MTLTIKDMIQCCPECGSGDVRFCGISVRPYCVECDYWAPINFGTEHDAIKKWNDKLEQINKQEGNKMTQRKIMIEITRTERMMVEVSAEQGWDVPEDLTELFKKAERLKNNPEDLWHDCKDDHDIETVSCEVIDFKIEE